MDSWLQPLSGEVSAAIDACLAQGKGRRIACFDADGTLWSEDIGEAFLRWLIAGGLLPRVADLGDPYADYERRVRENRTAGYEWAVTSMAGLAEQDVRLWARQLAAAWPNWRPAMSSLVRGLAARRCEVWIVSASNGWIIEAAAPTMGFDPGNALGIRTAVVDGILTDRVVRPVPSEGGKVEVIRRCIGEVPMLAFGDSLGDLAMLEAADQPVVVGRHDQPGASILEIARQRGWPITLF